MYLQMPLQLVGVVCYIEPAIHVRRGSAVTVYQLCTHRPQPAWPERGRKVKHAAIHPVSSKGGRGSELLVGGDRSACSGGQSTLREAKEKGSLWAPGHGRGSRPKGPRAGRRLVESQSRDLPCAAVVALGAPGCRFTASLDRRSRMYNYVAVFGFAGHSRAEAFPCAMDDPVFPGARARGLRSTMHKKPSTSCSSKTVCRLRPFPGTEASPVIFGMRVPRIPRDTAACSAPQGL